MGKAATDEKGCLQNEVLRFCECFRNKVARRAVQSRSNPFKVKKMHLFCSRMVRPGKTFLFTFRAAFA